jgi:hypothetical protein
MHKGFKCLDVSAGRIYISRDVVFDEKSFPFSELHANAGARLRSEIALFPSTLFDLSMPFGSTTVPTTDAINSSTNPMPDSDQNPEETPAAEPVFHAVVQGETCTQIGEDRPAPGAAPTSASPSESASGAANPPPVA